MDMEQDAVQVRPLRQITGEAEFNELFMEEARIPDENVVGGVGNGWTVAITTLMHERAGLGFGSAIALKIALGELMELVRERGLDEDPVIRQRIAQLYIEAEALRLNASRGLTQIMKTGIPGPEGSLVKWQWSDSNQALTELAMDIRGAEAPLVDESWTYRFLRARANSIEGGTTEILKNIVAERVLGLPQNAMNFDYTDDQQAIKSTARDFLASRYKLEKVRELAEAGEYDDALWGEISELGWPGIFIEEGHGGQELGQVELTIVMEELGYALAPSPFFSNAAAGTADRARGQRRAAPALAAGDRVGREAGHRGGRDQRRRAACARRRHRRVIVLIDNGSASVVEAGSAEPERSDTIDSTRRFFRVQANGGEALEGDVDGAIQRIEVALAAELVGVAQRAMEMAVEYAKDRKQFDRPIGAYQAVSHRCAQMLLEVESARATTLYASWAADHEPESLALAASMAKAYASDAGWRVTASSLQVHGGIGFTWEHDLHFFLKRARTDGALFGSAREHRDRVAELAGLSRSAAAV